MTVLRKRRCAVEVVLVSILPSLVLQFLVEVSLHNPIYLLYSRTIWKIWLLPARKYGSQPAGCLHICNLQFVSPGRSADVRMIAHGQSWMLFFFFQNKSPVQHYPVKYHLGSIYYSSFRGNCLSGMSCAWTVLARHMEEHWKSYPAQLALISFSFSRTR
ncbi:hypothetical protein F5Y17DRAFT_25299 [Xylariaceae sp. FL0594]|nr:hypothetical protein F5Y17DRAFT_25299 [Xylariaceae sp. FL0594]